MKCACVQFYVTLQEKRTSRDRSQSSGSGSSKKEKKGKKKKPVGGVALFGPSSVGSSGSGGLFGEEDDEEENAKPASGKVCACAVLIMQISWLPIPFFLGGEGIYRKQQAVEE